MSLESCLQASLGIFPSPRGYIEGQSLYSEDARNIYKNLDFLRPCKPSLILKIGLLS